VNEPESAATPSPQSGALVVLTGLSGAGKSTALHALEDLSFYCVDNLPTPLIRETLEVCAAGGLTRVAIGLDVRVRSFLEQAGEMIDDISRRHDREVHVLFLDATDEALLRRYSETRRPHPLSAFDRHEGAAIAVLDGIRFERAALSPLRARATRIIDTTHSSVHDLRRRIVSILGPISGHVPRMRTRILSFGFKYGMPMEADVVFDVRFLDNPYFVPELKALPGTNQLVVDYVMARTESREFLEKARSMLEFTLPLYEREGKAYLTIAIGCTGGRHRSVVIADALAEQLRVATGAPASVYHRDVDRGPSAVRESDAPALSGTPRGRESG
jgi:UPF0042 nucleotide-binding protein